MKQLQGLRYGLQAEVDSDREFFYDSANNRVILYSYSDQNPADKYSDIEITKGEFGIDLRTRDYVTISDLEIKYVNVHGIRGGSAANAVTNITISYVDISYTGGKVQNLADKIRYGNGIEFWQSANDILVEYCNITQIYDAGLTNQSDASADVTQTNITYRYNNVTYSKMGIEIWSQNAGELSNIYVLNNTFSQMGYGWSGTSATIFAGSPFYAYNPDATVNNIVITDNIFDGAADGLDEVVLIGGGDYRFERNIVRNGATDVEGVWIKKQQPQAPGKEPNVDFNYNLVYGNGKRGVRIGDGASLHEGTISLYNNVIINNGDGVTYSNLQVSQLVAGTLTLKNNIMKGYTTMIRALDLSDPKVPSGTTRDFAFDYNSYYRIPEVPEKDMIYYYGNYYTLSQFSDYQTASGQDASSIAQDPLLADAANNDFHLQLNSPCIDSGETGTVVELPPEDFEGYPINLPRDIGAYECQRSVWNLSTNTYYDSLQAAYNEANNGEIIQSQGLIFTEDLNSNRSISVALEGSFNCNYTSTTGTTTINGSMTISDGTVTAGGFELE